MFKKHNKIKLLILNIKTTKIYHQYKFTKNYLFILHK